MFKKENLFRVSAFIPEFIKPGDIENNLNQVSKLLKMVDTESDLVLVSYGSLSGIVDKNSTFKNFKDVRLGIDRAARELQKKLDKSNLVYSIIIPEFDSFILIKPRETIWLDENYLLIKHPDEENEGDFVIQLFTDYEIPKHSSKIVAYLPAIPRKDICGDNFISTISGLNRCFAILVDTCPTVDDVNIFGSSDIIADELDTDIQEKTNFGYFDVDLDRCRCGGEDEYWENKKFSSEFLVVDNSEFTEERNCINYLRIFTQDWYLDNVFNGQVKGTTAKLLKLGNPNLKCLVGVSGGSDSTLTLLVLKAVYENLGWDKKNIVGVTMPCFGTTDRTKNNALKLMEALGITSMDINIGDSVTSHLKEINHLLTDTNNTYENAQARMRTLTLFDLANDLGGIVIGTGDLSEAWLGWCTYGGDNLCVYNPNAYVLKTQVLGILGRIRDDSKDSDYPLYEVLDDIIETPISPELVRGGSEKQRTEDIIGPYILHDYFICGFLEGWNKEKVLSMCYRYLMPSYTKSEVEVWLGVNVSRFSGSQFKRAMKIPGPKANWINVNYLDNLPNDLIL